MLTLAQANGIATAARAHAATNAIAPLCVTVLDAGGHPLAVQRDERASLYRPDIAAAKAMGCLGMGFGGRAVAQRAGAAPAFYAAVGALRPLLPVPGGVLIRDAAGVLLGAVGISGDTAPNDEACAVAGIAAAGLVADTGA
ncbi:GlcG/HbpS family heme-binding protein [Sphingomonas sp.]|uniref:GlcG/HbpS family heme-binding protein n=1 Tax=Sphingomonas sp. TaxID=28214 RepID=UPI003CC6A8D8